MTPLERLREAAALRLVVAMATLVTEAYAHSANPVINPRPAMRTVLRVALWHYVCVLLRAYRSDAGDEDG